MREIFLIVPEIWENIDSVREYFIIRDVNFLLSSLVSITDLSVIYISRTMNYFLISSLRTSLGKKLRKFKLTFSFQINISELLNYEKNKKSWFKIQLRSRFKFYYLSR